MIGFAVGSLDASRTEPRLSGVSRQAEAKTPCSSGSVMPSSMIWSGTVWNWMSGASAPASTRAKPPASAKLEVNDPRPRGFEFLQRGGLHRQQQADRLRRGPHAVGARVVAEVLAHRGLVEAGLDFAHLEVSAGPIPESISSCGELIGAAAEDHLAPGAQLLRLAEPRRLDADRALSVEEDPVDLGEGHDGQVRSLASPDGGRRPRRSPASPRAGSPGRRRRRPARRR